MSTLAELSSQIAEYLENPAGNHCRQSIARAGIGSLPVLAEFLREDSPIARTECLETLVKLVLREVLTRPISGADARSICRFQKALGFTLKYKSYAIKASAPLGYSVFLQKEGEGFSFQRHIEHKLEVFHILEVKPGGYVFLCDFEDWKRAYTKDSFERWLAGESHPVFDRFKFVPDPGDVFVISTLGVVHTVVGCVLEEFATVSTDMVDRLHDQNAGKKIPADFTRAFVEAALLKIEPPARNRMVKGFGAREIETVQPTPVPGGEQFLLCDSFVRAARYVIRTGAETAIERDDQRAVLVRISRGRGSAVIADASELRGSHPRMDFSKGDLLLIPPGIHFSVRNEASGRLEYSEHRIAPDVAFI